MTKNIKLEVCVDSLEGAVVAQKAGAYRLELCSGLIEGGITPSFGLIKSIRELDIKLNVLIRPRGGDFLYTDFEYEIMKQDIHICGKLGCDGVVIGVLNPDGTIDKDRNRELIRIAHTYSMSVTFHRAFDRTNDLFRALEDVIGLKCDRILTSGGYDSALKGAEILLNLKRQAGNKIIIMPGAGITPQNACELIEKTEAAEIHGTFRSKYNSEMLYRNTELSNQDEEYTYLKTDYNKIKTVILSINI